MSTVSTRSFPMSTVSNSDKGNAVRDQSGLAASYPPSHAFCLPPLPTVSTRSLSCSICLGPFNQPKILPCLHTFCKPCLEKLCGRKENEDKLSIPLSLSDLQSSVEIRCPQCKGIHKTRIEALPTDYSLQQEVAVQALVGGDKSAATLSCGLCYEKKGHAPVGYCRLCRNFICQSCYDAHQRMKTFKTHSVVLMVNIKPHMLSVDIYCSVHNEELLSRYCGTCGVSICRECALDVHYKHKMLTTNDAKEKVKKSMQGLHTEVSAKLQQSRSHLEIIKTMEDHVIQYKEQLKKEVNTSCDLAVKNVEAARKSLISEIDDTYGEQSKKVWAEKDVVERTILAQEGCLAFTDRLLKSTNDTEMVLLSSQAISRLKILKEESSWNKKSIELTSLVFEEKVPVTVGDIAHFNDQRCINISIPSRYIVAEREYSFSIVATKSIFKASTVTVIISADGFKQSVSNLDIGESKWKIGDFNPSQNCWDGTFSCKKKGTYTMTATITLFGKVFGTASTDFCVSPADSYSNGRRDY